MRVIAYYQRSTPAFYRRLGAIFSTLTHRGYAAMYQQVAYASQIKVSSYDAVILHDWTGIGSYDRLPEIPGQYIYDLSDAALYQDPSARNIMEQCALVFVPSPGIKAAFSPHLKTVVQPSVVPAEMLTQAPVTSPEKFRLALLTPFDWTGILAPLREFLSTTDAQLVTDDPVLAGALTTQLPAQKTLFVPEISPVDYLTVARSSHLLLCPGVSPVADPAIQLDFGYVGTPALVSPCYAEDLPVEGRIVCRSERDWLAGLTDLAAHDRKRGVLSAAAQQRSRRFTATRLADRWWRTTAKFCASAG